MGMKNKTKQVLRKGAKVGQTILTYNYQESKKARDYYVRHYDGARIDEKTILYESRDGQSMTDSPLAIYLHMKSNAKYADYRHVWVAKDISDQNVERLLANVPKAFREGIIWVERNSISYAKWLLKAKYLVTNSTFQSFVSKKENQVYINTWHGTPLKYMGYDIPGSKVTLKNVQRNFLMADYILSPNAHTSRIFLDRYKLDGLFEGKVVEAGYTRIDFTIQGEREQTLTYLKNHDVNITATQPIVLYTPTWKGTSINNPSQNLGQLKAELEILRTHNPDKNILIKVHPYAYNTVKTDAELSAYLVPDELDANQVLAIVDTLITDYSSIFFDYLVTDKPIIFYTWDAELYASYRGMYFEDNVLPGPVVDDIQVVAELLKRPELISDKYQAKYDSMKSDIVKYDDGNVTARIVDYIFDNGTPDNMKIYEPAHGQKEKILIYPGGMQNNGITSSAINLSNQIDYEKYDVTFLVWDNAKPEVVANIEKLNPKARLVYRFGPRAFKLRELSHDSYVSRYGISSPDDKKMPKQAYKREANRLFNSTQYDVLIDFSGYSFNGLKLFTVMPSHTVAVYQHNDLKLEAKKVIDGKKVHERNLNAIFTLYQLVDYVVSVSDVLKQINETKLSEYVKPSQMMAVPNLLTTSEETSENVLETQEHIRDIQADATFKTQSVHEFINVEAIRHDERQLLVVDDESQLSVVGEAIINDKKFYKIALDFIPRGWVSEDEIEVEEQNKLQFEQAIRRVAWIYRGRRRLFKTPYLSGDDDVVSNVKWIGHTFVNVLKKAQTNDGIYYQLQLPDRAEKVWLKDSGLLLMQEGHVRGYQKLWNRVLNRHSELAHQKDKKIIRVKSAVQLTSIPKGLNKRVETVRSVRTPGMIFIVDEQSVTQSGVFLRIEIDSKHWWINQSDVEVLDLNLDLTPDHSVPLTDYVLTDKHTEIVLHDSVDKYMSVGIDTHKLGAHYQLRDADQLSYKETLTDQVERTTQLMGTVQLLAKVSLESDQESLLYVLTQDDKCIWVRESLLRTQSANSAAIDDNYDYAKTSVQKKVDLFTPVKALTPRLTLDTPWITRDISVQLDGRTYTQLIRQNGQTIISTDDGETQLVTPELVVQENNLIEGDGRGWADIHHFTFVAVGRLSPEKNQTMLLNAFAQVYKQHPEAELIILGDGIEREKLQAQARQLNIADAVLFAGQVSDPKTYLAAADVLVHPSLYEGQPMVLLEALMQNRRIIATNIKANVGVLGNQEYGLITNGVEADSFANTMINVIEKQYDIKTFNVVRYQQETLQRFENMISQK